jgi:hypothetical protein
MELDELLATSSISMTIDMNESIYCYFIFRKGSLSSRLALLFDFAFSYSNFSILATAT